MNEASSDDIVETREWAEEETVGHWGREGVTGIVLLVGVIFSYYHALSGVDFSTPATRIFALPCCATCELISTAPRMSTWSKHVGESSNRGRAIW